jgi:hypothetical protein
VPLAKVVGNAGNYVVMHGQHFPLANLRKDKARSRFCLVRTRTRCERRPGRVVQFRPRDKLYKPGIHSAANVAGNAIRTGDLASSDTRSPAFTSSATILWACLTPVCRISAIAPRGNSPRYSTASNTLLDLAVRALPSTCASAQRTIRLRNPSGWTKDFMKAI